MAPRPSPLKRTITFLFYVLLVTNSLFLAYHLFFYYMRHSDEVPASTLKQYAELESINENVKEFRIPNIVHFVFGMKADFGGKPFRFCHSMHLFVESYSFSFFSQFYKLFERQICTRHFTT